MLCIYQMYFCFRCGTNQLNTSQSYRIMTFLFLIDIASLILFFTSYRPKAELKLTYIPE